MTQRKTTQHSFHGPPHCQPAMHGDGHGGVECECGRVKETECNAVNTDVSSDDLSSHERQAGLSLFPKRI